MERGEIDVNKSQLSGVLSSALSFQCLKSAR